MVGIFWPSAVSIEMEFYRIMCSNKDDWHLFKLNSWHFIRIMRKKIQGNTMPVFSWSLDQKQLHVPLIVTSEQLEPQTPSNYQHRVQSSECSHPFILSEKGWTGMIMMDFLRSAANRPDWRRVSESFALRSHWRQKAVKRLMKISLFLL